MHYKCNSSAFPPYPLPPWRWRLCVPLGIRSPGYSVTLDPVCLCIDCRYWTTVVIFTFHLKYGDFLKAPCLYFAKFAVYKKVQNLSLRSIGTDSVPCSDNVVHCNRIEGSSVGPLSFVTLPRRYALLSCAWFLCTEISRNFVGGIVTGTIRGSNPGRGK